MPQRCRVCDHLEKAAINAAIVASVSYRDVSARFGVSLSSVKRHANNHIGDAIQQARAAVLGEVTATATTQARHEIGAGLDICRQLVEINATCQSILHLARDVEDPRLALQAVDRIAKQLELQAKLLGQIDGPVSVTLAPDWLTFRTRIVAALSAFPEARRAVLAALEVTE